MLDRTLSAGYLTNWAARLFARAIDRRLKPLGLASGQMPILFALAGGGALTQKRLAAIAAIEQPTMAATLARMERDGLVKRTPDPNDRRSALVALTPAAERKAAAVREAVEEVNAAALSRLGTRERAAFLKALQTVTGALEEDLGGGA
ncbi:MAG: MarR family winged helix-turn-helix transcriptional regulator [Alphaproteobacteria bacterium]|jgi:DNA-binding MarR family transcriptional regulator